MSRLLVPWLAVQIAPNPRCIGDTFYQSPSDFDRSAGKRGLPAEFLLLWEQSWAIPERRIRRQGGAMKHSKALLGIVPLALVTGFSVWLWVPHAF